MSLLQRKAPLLPERAAESATLPMKSIFSMLGVVSNRGHQGRVRPLMDALGEMVDYDQARNLMEQDVIEVIPLAYMRGRTLSDAFIILDEAQNTTVAQMKMFLTRMGERSKMVVSGDATQQDLPRGVTSGLRDAIKRLGKIDAIGIVRLQASDIVRHRLVQKIVEAYDDLDQRQQNSAHGDQTERR